MKHLTERLLEAFFAAHHGVITRQQALELGVSPRQIDWAVRSGRWQTVFRGAYRRDGAPVDATAAALAALGAVGAPAVVSHRSAALLWDLVDRPGPHPSVTVPVGRRCAVPGVEVHRSTDWDLRPPSVRRNVPVTDPLRTLADLGQVVTGPELDIAVDRARASRLVTVKALEAEIARLARPGREGPAMLRQALRRRGFIEAPAPTVLESHVARLLKEWGVEVLDVETTVLHGRYRLDFLLREDLCLEVDGFAFHSSPEAKASDARRRADLAAMGIQVIEADWVLVMRRPEEFRRLVLRAVAGPRPATRKERRPPGRRRPPAPGSPARDSA